MTTTPTKVISLGERLLQDLKERLLKFGTVRALWLIPLGILGIWIVLNAFQYSLHIILILVCVSAIGEGIYQLLHNPVKKEATLQKMVTFRNQFDADVKLAEADVEGFLEHIKHLCEKKLGTSVAIVPFKTAVRTATGPAAQAAINKNLAPPTPVVSDAAVTSAPVQDPTTVNVSTVNVSTDPVQPVVQSTDLGNAVSSPGSDSIASAVTAQPVSTAQNTVVQPTVTNNQGNA